MAKRVPLEAAFVKQVKADILERFPGAYVRKNMAVAILGIPDVECGIEGLYVALECKRSKSARLQPLQQYTIDKINNAGCFARITYPENWDEVLRELTELLERKRHV